MTSIDLAFNDRLRALRDCFETKRRRLADEATTERADGYGEMAERTLLREAVMQDVVDVFDAWLET